MHTAAPHDLRVAARGEARDQHLRDTFLPRAVTGDLHVAFGITEPNAGTDTSRIATRAVRDAASGDLRPEDLDDQGDLARSS